MKIFLLHPHDIYSQVEPWTIRIVRLGREFVKKGHDVKLAYFPFEPENSPLVPAKAQGLELIPLSRKIDPVSLIKNTILLYKAIGWADVVHFQKCHHYAAVPLLAAGILRGKPIHYDWDDWEEKIFYHSNKLSFSIFLVGSFFSILEKIIPQIVDTVSVSSRKLKNLCIGVGVPEKRIFMAPVGAHLEQFNPNISGVEIKNKYSPKLPLVLYLGQLHGGQYAELLIKAAKLILENKVEANFMIIGGGYRLGELKTLANSLGIEKNIIFTDKIAHELIPEYVAASDVCVACFEDNDITRCKSPLKIAEYLASGKAIVASNVGEVRNMAGGVALLVKPGDVQALALGIEKLLRDSSLRLEMGRRARKRAEVKYNWAKTADNLLDAYKTARYLKNNLLKEVLVPARDYERGNLNRTVHSFGENLAIDGGVSPSFAEYDIYFPYEGKYALWIKYASQIPRPCRIYVNNRLICRSAMADTTDGWTADDAKWFKQCELDIISDFYTLKLYSENIFPHIVSIKFQEISPAFF